jgi:hypothetical protein
VKWVATDVSLLDLGDASARSELWIAAVRGLENAMLNFVTLPICFRISCASNSKLREFYRVYKKSPQNLWKLYASMGSLGSASIFTTKIMLRSKFSSAGGLFLNENTLEMACAQKWKA